MIKVMIVDDHPIVRDGLEAMLESARDFEVVAGAASGEEAVKLITKAKPDVVVLDIRLPGMDGFATLERLHKLMPSARALMLAGMPLKVELERARSLGAAGYLPKNVEHKKLLAALRAAAAGEGFQEEEELPAVPSMLTARESEVLKYLALGKTREEVSIILGIGVETVRTYTKSLLIKLDATNTPGAISRAYELGILRA